MDDLMISMRISAAGMKVQGKRLQVIAQNLANKDSTGVAPGSEPYRRKIITFQNVLDEELGIEKVSVAAVDEDHKAPFKQFFEPSHPAANEAGYVLYPNVNGTIESSDMKEAQRTYEANLGAVEIAHSMLAQTMELLKR